LDRQRLGQVSFDELLRLIREEEPPMPSARLSGSGEALAVLAAQRRVDPAKLPGLVRGELDWIVMKALEKDRARRYETANALARDLMRYLADQPVEACPPSLGYRLTKYARRNRTVLAMAAVVSSALIAGTTISTWQAIRATGAEKRTAAALDEAKQQRLLAERHLYAALLRQAREAMDVGQIEHAQATLEEFGAGADGHDPRDFAWYYLRQLTFREIAPFVKHSAGFVQFGLSFDGHILASGDKQGTIILTDVASGQPRAKWKQHTAAIRLLAFSPDGSMLASVAGESGPGSRHEAWIWDLAAGRRLAELDASSSRSLSSLAFSASNRRLVTTSEPGPNNLIAVQLFDVESQPGHPVLVRSLHVHPAFEFALGHAYFVARPLGGLLTVFDTETLQPRWSTSVRDEPQNWPVLSADGRRLGTEDGHSAVVWDTATGREVSRFPAEKVGPDLWKIQLSRDGRELLVKYKPLRFSLFDSVGSPSIPPPAFTIEKPGQGDLQLAEFSPDGSKLAVLIKNGKGDDWTLAIYESATGRVLATCTGRPRKISCILFAPDGESVLMDGAEAVQRWWFNRSKSRSPQSLAGHLDEAWAVAFSPDGKTLATGSDDTEPDDTIKLWDAGTGRLMRGWRTGEGTISALAFSPDGQTLASAAFCPTANVKLWDAANGRLRATLEGHSDRVRTVAFSPDGRRLASAGSDLTIRLWDGATGKAIAALAGHTDRVRKVAFSPDGHFLASASEDKTVRIWDLATQKPTRKFRTLDECNAVAFGPDGSLLAAADAGGDVTLLNSTTGDRKSTIHGDHDQLLALVFSPDGRILASAGSSRVIRLRDVLTGQELLALTGHAAQINSVAFSSDGRTLASCSHDGAVKLWGSGE
jgi:WD40 repeat protein